MSAILVPKESQKHSVRKFSTYCAVKSMAKPLGFDPETCEELRTQLEEGAPDEEIFEIAYGHLTQAGANADEVLAPWMEQQDTEQ